MGTLTRKHENLWLTCKDSSLSSSSFYSRITTTISTKLKIFYLQISINWFKPIHCVWIVKSRLWMGMGVTCYVLHLQLLFTNWFSTALFCKLTYVILGSAVLTQGNYHLILLNFHHIMHSALPFQEALFISRLQQLIYNLIRFMLKLPRLVGLSPKDKRIFIRAWQPILPTALPINPHTCCVERIQRSKERSVAVSVHWWSNLLGRPSQTPTGPLPWF